MVSCVGAIEIDSALRCRIVELLLISGSDMRKSDLKTFLAATAFTHNDSRNRNHDHEHRLQHVERPTIPAAPTATAVRALCYKQGAPFRVQHLPGQTMGQSKSDELSLCSPH